MSSPDRVPATAPLQDARARWDALYALHIYLPVSGAARSLRRLSRALRGRADANPTKLPQAAWTDVLPGKSVRLTETGKRDGNVNLSEVAILAKAASAVPPGSEIIEIGTFDGRTALNLAVNAPEGVAIATLDLPANQPTAFPIEASERQYVEKPSSGDRLRSCHPRWRGAAARVVQLFGDSATYDWSPHRGRAGLVFVDGSHIYDYARRDSETAMRLVRPGGVVLWHDYGVWPGVTRALEELEAGRKLGLKHIRGTSLVFWRAPAGRQ
jgi:hypothetical protein